MGGLQRCSGEDGRIRLPLGRCSGIGSSRVLREGVRVRFHAVLKVGFDRFLSFNRNYKKRTHR